MDPDYPVCLTIAGSDSSGGAGIQADLKTFVALGVFGASAITALTAQNTTGVLGILAIDPEFVRLQADAVFADLPVAAAKTGMLGEAATIEAVAEVLEQHPRCPLVVDPVMVARSGDPLLAAGAIDVLRERLLPRATVITPNRLEASLLAGSGPVTDASSLREVARALFERFRRPVLIKGGRALPGALDLLIDENGEYPLTIADGPLESRSTHGTGCTFSAALTALLARGHTLRDAAAEAKQYVSGAIRHAPGLGAGHGPVHHGWMIPGERAESTGL